MGGGGGGGEGGSSVGESRTRDRKVTGSIPGTNGGRMFSVVSFLF